MTISGYHMTIFEFYDIKLCALVVALQSPQIWALYLFGGAIESNVPL